MARNNSCALPLLIVVLASFMAISEQAECPTNSTMNQCGNGCEPNCEDDSTKSMWCPNSLCPGPACACDEGFFRNSKGQCVVVEECPIRVVERGPIRCDMPCPEGKECMARTFQCFPAGAPCPSPVPECKNLPNFDTSTFNVINDTVSESPDIIRCDLPCTGSKQCWARQFNCTPAAPCPPNMPMCINHDLWVIMIGLPVTCPGHSELRLCGTACEQTCQDVGKPLNCTIDMCAEPGCKCTQGFFRHPNGECVPAEECPQ